ncbi:hypothetical protein [Streptomyces cyaneofuscatus]|uniref:hypothetical protein n=1 Tax=Streptomyces cyaneofuscatus TaxID=66883 RepID=UPI0036595599
MAETAPAASRAVPACSPSRRHSPPSGPSLRLSYGQAGSASTSQHDGTCWECGPDKAFDRDPASRWATGPEGDWPGSSDSTTCFPQKLSVDYIKVWQ